MIKKSLIVASLLLTTYSLSADEKSFFKGSMGQGYCNTKWTMTFWKSDENGRICTKLGKRKWINSCMLAYSKYNAPTRKQITETAKKQWNIK